VIAGISAVLVVLVIVGGCSPSSDSSSTKSSTTTTPAPTASVVPQPAQPSASVTPQPAQPSTSRLPQPTQPSTSQQYQPNPSTKPGATQPAQTAKAGTVKVYWVNNVNKKVEVVPTSVLVKNADKPDELLEGAFIRLLAGPSNPAVSTTIPKGTKLKKLAVKPDGVHVDFSEEFTKGGGSASMTGRVAQVIYTASSLNPAAKVWISVEGKPLEMLGGEGLMLDQPITRETFEKDFNL